MLEKDLSSDKLAFFKNPTIKNFKDVLFCSCHKLEYFFRRAKLQVHLCSVNNISLILSCGVLLCGQRRMKRLK